MSQGERKRHTYIEEMISRYVQHAWSDAELAQELQTDRTNIWRIRTEILEYQMGIPIYEESRGKYRINREHFVSYVRLTPPETLALYLGGRRLQQQTRTGQQDVASALRKLAEALRKPLMQNLVRSAQFVLDQEQDERQSEVMRVLVEAWINNRRVRIRHRKHHGQVRTYTVSPYQLEPAVWGDGTYLIGESDYHNGLATFKVARIESATLTAEPFSIPEDFDSLQLLQHAWGIWHADHDPDTVRLKFSPAVTPRVKETIWHPEQTIQDVEGGGCIWESAVAEWREMVPWVRGWGGDVEVLEPQPLRQIVTSHVRHQAEIYGVIKEKSNMTTRLLRLWGKTTSEAHVFHPALYHMLDVAHVAQQFLSHKATPRWRRILAHTFSSDMDSLHEWLPWLIALHDIGKISIPFQVQNEIQRWRLDSEGFDFGSYSADHKALYHPMIGRIVFDNWVKMFPQKWQEVVLDMVAGHHGTYQAPERREKRLWRTLGEPQEWETLRQHAIQLLRGFLLLSEPQEWPQPDNISAAIVALNGFTILCDWLGSDENFFSAQPHMPLEEYLVHSRTQARARVESAGFFTPTCGRTATDFASLFGWAPRPLQQAVNNIPTELLSNPTLTIIEAPTGEGKTEAALTLAHRIGDALGSDEMYIALPTTATSNAMYGRIQEHLQDRLGLPATSARLIHGQDFLVEDDLGIAPANNDDGDDHPALSWFAPKKRALLAPFGVGTVDQVELAALNVRHNALRLIGLAGKVVILDEVHAYDTYMMTTISRMLEWLSTLGCSVILLSATLPIAKRKELVEAYTGGALAADAFEDYPLLLTTGSGEYFSASPEPIQPDRRIRVRYLNFAEEDWQGKAQWLVKQAESGGCVCWMTNTVHHAQQIFEAVREIAPPDIDCDLLHARFPISDRQKQEEKILTKYGKEENGRRPHKSIIIGTQVLEQSLDIDFDLLVSDLAPVDLLLQRIGRLHRHAQRRNRSSVHMGPIVFINAVLGDDGQLMMGADRFYTPYLLHKTWTALHERIADEEFLVLPRDYRPFVETVYDEVEPDCDSPWHNLWQDRERKESKYRDEARLRLANAPDAQQPFWKGSGHTFHEDEESNRWVVAQTRYQEQESITVIPMERLDVNQVRLVGTNDQFALGEAAGRPDQIRILRHSVRLSNYYVVTALKSEFHKGEIPPLFKQSALLKRCYPMWLEDSEWSATVSSKNVSIRLDQALGLVIEIKNPHVGGENS